MGSFKTSARAVELLGRKQIRDSITALAELMKNSYDADAEFLQVDFVTSENKSISLCDNGVGMDEEDIKNKWLVLGTKSKKSREKRTTEKNRRLMGEKGIGRLAVARLGQQMWLISKKKDSGWNILFLNWNLFENPDLFLDDVQIPAEYNVSFLNFERCFKHLKELQLKNLEVSIWNTEKHIKTKQHWIEQIERNQPDLKLINELCEQIELEGNQGTIIYSNCLNDDWYRYLSAEITTKEDLVATKNKKRLHAFINDLNNADDDFKTEIFLDGEVKKFDAEFNNNDFSIYDVKIEGRIEKGLFFGEIDAKNVDANLLYEANKILSSGFNVTAGILNWEKYDCGPFAIKFCHVESEKGKSSLTDDERKIVEERNDIVGGISIYRDNVRVLPYGELENDFLGIEQRRTKHAGNYMFSHRNTYGRIDITSAENPMLEDKSSREGLLENEEFYYFIKTIENLLIRLARELLTDARVSSLKLRDSYVKKNEKNYEKKKRISAYEKELDTAYNAEKRRAEQRLKLEKKKINSFINNQVKFIDQLINEMNGIQDITYKELLSKSSELDHLRRKLQNELKMNEDEALIETSEKFEHRYSVDFLDEIEGHNHEITRMVSKHVEYIEGIIQELSIELSEEIKRQKDRFVNKEKIVRNLMEKHEEIKKVVKSNQSTIEEMIKNCETIFSKRSSELDQLLKQQTKFSEEIIAEVQDLSKNYYGSLESFEEKLKRIDVSDKEDIELDQKMQVLTKEILELESSWKDNFEKSVKIIDEERESRESQFKILESKFNSEENFIVNDLSRDNYHLKNELEIYSDLASLGLNAEIVDHEMNQLFVNVFDAINQAKLGIDDEYAEYYLNQIDAGFRAISSRQSQLSPGLRTKNTYKKKINIRKMIDDLSFFFVNRLEHNGIDFINKVSEDVELKISLSKVYPVLSNIIYNGIYWVTDRDEKKILVHYDRDENALYIEDSGPGITPRIKDKIFEPFFSTSSTGRGLGLTISKKVLEEQGYSLEVVLDQKDKILVGACFKIKFNEESLG
ncbi:ATP-binding protein [Enterococcus ureasiticus]|uniref:histidine kinase n=1 Tax=Enterococcus ureasiticus TaxID=903984 RepID=A0A1E5GE58_9ENTE|nr:ATP-binding protein [Enterococcus ureasiticus]OEG10998.1 hypothetical protein BCR21_12005 [Enterococcus ureasiticus]